jgi:hypothetical protein
VTQPVVAPIYNQQIVSQGLARLTTNYITKPNVRALLAVYLQPFQDLEDATFGVLNDRILATAVKYSLPTTNVVFDVIGALIGQTRGPLSDEAYYLIILLRVAANRATGRITDWSKFAGILLPFCADTPIFYGDQGGIYFGCWDVTLPPVVSTPNIVASVLGRAVGAGIAGKLAYSTWADGNDFEFTSRYDSSAGQGKWASRYDSTVGGLLVAGAQMA